MFKIKTMKLLNKEITVSFYSPNAQEGALFGIEVVPVQCECCGNIGQLTRVGVGFLELNICIENLHK